MPCHPPSAAPTSFTTRGPGGQTFNMIPEPTTRPLTLTDPWLERSIEPDWTLTEPAPARLEAGLGPSTGKHGVDCVMCLLLP
jgi:hypothetical protein